MIQRTSLLLAILLSIPVAAIAQPKVEVRPARTDAFGDRLPPGAVARLGTLRWRATEPVRNVAFAPDGKRILAAGESSLFLFDYPGGRLIRIYPLANPGGVANLRFTADGKSVIFGGLVEVDNNQPIPLTRLDLSSGAMKHIPLAADDVDLLGFDMTPGERWALKCLGNGVTFRVVLNDMSGRERERQLARFPFTEIAHCKASISATGKLAAVLFLTSANEQLAGRLLLIDTTSGKLVSTTVPAYEGADLKFSPDEKELFCIAGKSLLRLEVKAAAKTGEAPEWRLIQRHSMPESGANLTLLPDGKQVITTGEQGGVTLWDISNQKLRKVWGMDFDVDSAPLAAVSPDGKVLSVATKKDNRVRLWEVATRRELFRYAGGHRGVVHDLTFHPNGKALISAGADGEIRTWDLTPKRVVLRSNAEIRIEEERYSAREWATLRTPAEQRDEFTKVFLSETGKELFARSATGNIWNWQTHERAAPKIVFDGDNGVSAYGSPCAVSSDGKIIAVTPQEGGVRLYDSEVRGQLDNQPGIEEAISDLYFTPNTARLSIVTVSGRLIYWDCRTGKEVPRAPDFKPSLGQRERYRLTFDGDEGQLEIWDTTMGRVIRHLPNLGGPLAMSPDGRYVVHTALDGSATISETSTMLCVHTFNPQGPYQSVSFSPDGKLVAMGYPNGTILLWDIRALSPKSKSDPEAIQSAWKELASTENGIPFKAMGILQAAPTETLALFRDKLRSADAMDAATLTKLFQDLDHDRFAVRERATKRLIEIADTIDGEIQRRRARASAEASWRLERVLMSKARLIADGEVLRRLRAIEVLERIGSAEARTLLKKLAEGREGVFERSARDALARLEYQLRSKPD